MRTIPTNILLAKLVKKWTLCIQGCNRGCCVQFYRRFLGHGQKAPFVIISSSRYLRVVFLAFFCQECSTLFDEETRKQFLWMLPIRMFHVKHSDWQEINLYYDGDKTFHVKHFSKVKKLLAWTWMFLASCNNSGWTERSGGNVHSWPCVPITPFDEDDEVGADVNPDNYPQLILEAPNQECTRSPRIL